VDWYAKIATPAEVGIRTKHSILCFLTGGEYVYNLFENGRDIHFYMSHDRINALTVDYITDDAQMDCILGDCCISLMLHVAHTAHTSCVKLVFSHSNHLIMSSSLTML
jgi:hypothetical protein